jgi:SsrA-binding protein
VATSKPAPGAPKAIRPLAGNRRARHDYHVLESLEAGLQLLGTEVKAARTGSIQLRESYVAFRDGQAYLVGAHISPYTHGNRENHLPDRERKLLLKRREIDRLADRVQTRGLTVVPLSMYLKGDRVKIELALAQGKKLYDKRESEKKKEHEREARAAMAAATKGWKGAR